MSLMAMPVSKLPDDVDTLKAMVLAMAEKAARAEALEIEVANLKALNASADERIARLTSILSGESFTNCMSMAALKSRRPRSNG